ncbi:MAG: PaaI family thioesterase [Clostridiales bacterium]|nr:PaaI family thioesterase [Clostridiales bacterium]
MNDLMRRVEEGIQKQSFGTMLGLKAVAAEAGCVTISCEKRADLLQQTGLLHGGVTGALCEAAAAYAALTVLPEGQSVIGVEYKINFLRAITSDKAIAVAKVIKQGRQLIVVDVEAFNEGSDKVAAKMIFTGTPVVG